MKYIDVDKATAKEILHAIYIDPSKTSKPKKKDLLANIQMAHDILTRAGIPEGSEQGAWTLYFRLLWITKELENARKALDNYTKTGTCGKHSKRFEVCEEHPDPEHATPDDPNHVAVTVYCTLCVNERLIEELRKLKTPKIIVSDDGSEKTEICNVCGTALGSPE